MLTNSIEPLIPSLSDRQQEILDDSGYNDLTTNTDNVINCAMTLEYGTAVYDDILARNAALSSVSILTALDTDTVIAYIES